MTPLLALAATAATVESSSDLKVDTIPRVEGVDRLNEVVKDARFTLKMEPPVTVMVGDGRQPFLFCSERGTLLCQSQLTAPPFGTKKKMVYPTRLGSAISRDGGRTWQRYDPFPGQDQVNLEGGAVELSDHVILMLDTYVVPSGRPGEGVGEIWRSPDDFKTLVGPQFVPFHLPEVNFTGSSDDGGRPHEASRVHRSILRLPNGDLLTSLYGPFAGDTAPSGYMVTMLKSRTVVARSRDQGNSWALLATVAVDGGVGTEGFTEPVLVRVSQGVHSGRLICLMRTGRDLYQSHSDDQGSHWSRARPVAIPGIDLYATEKWSARYGEGVPPNFEVTDAMIGDVVDPDLIEMKDGTLVCAAGVRIPARLFSKDWRVPENGNYLIFSRDGGDTWSEVVQFRSGAPTTQYMGIREAEPGVLFVAYDDSVWRMPGATRGFRLTVTVKP